MGTQLNDMQPTITPLNQAEIAQAATQTVAAQADGQQPAPAQGAVFPQPQQPIMPFVDPRTDTLSNVVSTQQEEIDQLKTAMARQQSGRKLTKADYIDMGMDPEQIDAIGLDTLNGLRAMTLSETQQQIGALSKRFEDVLMGQQAAFNQELSFREAMANPRTGFPEWQTLQNDPQFQAWCNNSGFTPVIKSARAAKNPQIVANLMRMYAQTQAPGQVQPTQVQVQYRQPPQPVGPAPTMWPPQGAPFSPPPPPATPENAIAAWNAAHANAQPQYAVPGGAVNQMLPPSGGAPQNAASQPKPVYALSQLLAEQSRITNIPEERRTPRDNAMFQELQAAKTQGRFDPNQ